MDFINKDIYFGATHIKRIFDELDDMILKET